MEEVNGTTLIQEMADQVAQMLGNKTAALKVRLHVVFTYHNSPIRRLLEGQRNLNVYTFKAYCCSFKEYSGKQAQFRGH